MFKFEDERAFPVTMHNHDGSSITNLGMSLRDYFAAKLYMSAFKAFTEGMYEADHDLGMNAAIAACAYQMADAMLVERIK